MTSLLCAPTGASNRPRRIPTIATALVAAFLLVLVGPAVAVAAPVNDDFEAATQITSLPFSGGADTAGSTTQAGEPQFCNFVDNSMWFAITPSADATVAASAGGGWPPAQLNVYRQDSSGMAGLSFLACQNWSSEPVVVPMQAGETYYIQASTLFFGSGQLNLEVWEVQPPPNDDFADASPITSVPFADSPDMLGASVEPGEPTSCLGAGQKTAWYAFTPSETDSYAVNRTGASWFVPLAVYTGDSLSSLSQVACAGSSTAIFRAQAGETYYLQLGHGFGSGPVGLSVDVAPPATATFYHYPSDPSIFDTVSFYDYSFDPAGIASQAWAFGDGATAIGWNATHRYAADGDYAARLDITTTDGRTASATHDIPVRTHDVAITKLSVPTAARVGQSRQLTVGVSNTRYGETVQVALLRSVPGGGFEQVGQVTQSVPVRTGGRTTSFSISYTFAAADAQLGKVSFQAVATIVGARDANAADNTVIALPTKVTS